MHVRKMQQTTPFRVALITVICLCSTPALAGDAAESLQKDRIARVESGLSTPVVIRGAGGGKMDLRERMAFHKVPAVSIALIENGRVEWARAYGTVSADGEPPRPATVDTLFQAASVSKPVSALGAMQLVQQGALSLDAPANDQLHAWKIPDNAFTRATPPTLRMLLNHNAGTTVHGYFGYPQGTALPSLLQVLDGAPPADSDPVRVDVQPGTLWRYSGGGFSVVQLMVTEATGQSFGQYMQRAVLDPLGMTHSTFDVDLSPRQRALAATGFSAEGTPVAGGWRRYPESAAAGLWTTPTDLAQVVLEVQRAADGAAGKVLTHASAQPMLTRGLGEYGLGLYVEDLGGRTSFAHSGGTNGFRAQIYGYTHSGQGVAILTNSDNGAALISEILASISAEYGWPEFKVIEKVAIAGDAAINQQIAGTYRLMDTPVVISAEGERLYLQSDLFGAARMELHAQSATAFFTTDQDMVLNATRNAENKVTGFSLVRGASTYAATRTE
nr:serine hydrolase [Pseudomonas corrugata]